MKNYIYISIFAFSMFSSVLFFDLRAQCGGECTTCWTSDQSNPGSAFELNDNDTLCIDATGYGTLQVDYDVIRFNGAAGIKIYGGSSDEVVFTSDTEFQFWGGPSAFINHGNFTYAPSGDWLSYSNHYWENYGNLQFNSNLTQNDGGLTNYSSGEFAIDGQFTVDGGVFDNRGTLDIQNNGMNLNSGSSLDNSGVVKTDGELVLDSYINAQGGIFDVGSFRMNSGADIESGTNDNCTAVMVNGTTTLSGGTVSSGEVQLTDDDGIETNNCGAGDCGIDITSNNTCYQTLPVTWLHFDGERKKEHIHLHWATLNEVNNDHFVVQRSRNGTSFEAIGTVDGAGTSFKRNDYHFTDIDASAGSYYYRIKQVDLDGNTEHSKTIYIHAFSGPSDIALYPNPAQNMLNIESDKPLKSLTWNNVMGTMVKHEQLIQQNSGTHYMINVQGMQPGVYKLHIKFSDNSNMHKKVVIR